MSTVYIPVDKATLKYVTHEGTYSKTKLIAINKVNISNSFNIPYVRGAVGLFNLIISRFMYYGDKYKKAQEYIYMSGAEGSAVINRCESQYWNIIRSFERIFDIKIKRAHESHGANTFRLSEQTIEFLKIFNESDLQEYINKYKIDNEDQYALRQIYNYRVVRPTDGNLSKEQKHDFYNSFMKNRKHRNFLHFCAQNNITPESRVIEIEAHKSFLSEKQREQLSNIKALLKATPGKLKHYFHWLLIKIQQFVSFKKNIEETTNKKSDQENTSKPSQTVNRNKTEGEQRTTDEVAQAHKKDPEEVTYKDIVEVAVLWNIMATGREMDPIVNLTKNKIESIYRLVKSHGKNEVIYTVRNTGKLYKADNMINLIQFKDFIYNSTEENSRFNKVSKQDKADTRLSIAHNVENMDRWFKFASIEVPEFKSAAKAKAWFKSNNNLM